MIVAMTIRENVGTTAWGLSSVNSLAISSANTPIANASAKKITRRNRTCARGPMTARVTSPMVAALWRTEATSVLMSWTAPMRMLPPTTHANAGAQPHTTAIAGPTIGATPAIDAK